MKKIYCFMIFITSILARPLINETSTKIITSENSNVNTKLNSTVLIPRPRMLKIESLDKAISRSLSQLENELDETLNERSTISEEMLEPSEFFHSGWGGPGPWGPPLLPIPVPFGPFGGGPFGPFGGGPFGPFGGGPFGPFGGGPFGFW